LCSQIAGCPADDADEPWLTGDAGVSRHHAHDDDDAGAARDQDEPDDAGKPSTPEADGGSKPSAADAGSGDPSKDPKPAASTDQHFFLPTIEPTNTVAPTIRMDARGGTHMLYPKYAGGGVFYAYCGKDCNDEGDVKPVLLDTDGTVATAALALTKDGKPRAILGTYSSIYYAQCDAGCTDASSWKLSVIDDHQGDRDVTGQALALDPQGRPRFIEHTYLAYLGVGQKPENTWYMQCDADCNEAGNWRRSEPLQDKIWFRSRLLIDDAGVAHLVTGIENFDAMSAGFAQAAYMECSSACDTADAWNGIALLPAFENMTEEVKQSLAMALTSQGRPRVVMLARDEQYQRSMIYLECDGSCTDDNWRATKMSDKKELGSGLDLTLTKDGHTRFAFTLGDNIGVYGCDEADCTTSDASWTLTVIERWSDLPKDDIILWPNCTVDAWILHDPSLAIAPDGSARVGYQATDLSGGTTVTDPSAPRCVAGKDMTLTRMSLMHVP
jgi:hypothetical protein